MYTHHFLQKIHYLSGAIRIQHDGVADSLLYTYSDVQGSLIALTDASGSLLTKTINGTVVETGRFAYEPWGARRNPMDWTQKDSRTSWIINRGYTGHEHLDAFGIINMNGRVYDPATGMFFSPDPTLTDEGNWLDYNRYSYCLNNPFRYTDPSGYSWWAENWKPVVTTVSSIIVTGVVGILTCGTGVPAVIASGMMAGAAGGFTAGVVGTALSGGSFDQCMNAGIQNGVMGGGIGTLSAGTGIIGDAFGHSVGSIGNELLRAGAHATLGGLMNVAQGDDFLEGFAVGAVSSLAGSGLQALGIDPTVGILSSGAVVGAGTAALMGGDVINGGFQGLAIGALNHWAYVNGIKDHLEIDEVLVKGDINLMLRHRMLQVAEMAYIAAKTHFVGSTKYTDLCSNFVYDVYKSTGHRLGNFRTAVDTGKYPTLESTDDPVRGDIVQYLKSDGAKFNHVAIYEGGDNMFTSSHKFGYIKSETFDGFNSKVTPHFYHYVGN